MRGAPVVLIPGLQTDHRSWRFQIRHLTEAGYEVIVPKGHYHAPGIKEMAAIVGPQIPAGSHVVAWSMGGYIALSLIAAGADDFASLALVGTSASPETAARTAERRRAMALAEAEGMAASHRAGLSVSCHDPDALDPALIADLSQMACDIGVDAFRSQQAAIIARPDGRPALQRFAGPVLILVGAEDRVTPPEFSREMHALKPGSRLVIVPGAGHCAPFEAPEAVNRVLSTWLATQGDRVGNDVATMSPRD
ncbi:MAG: alpha/beta fold hydrolase [Acuticoccus sp.]